LKAEIATGTRSADLAGISSRPGFKTASAPEPAVPGTLKPVFCDITGQLIGVGLVSADGRKHTTTAFTNRAKMEQHVAGFGLGRAALDNFAQKLGAADFDSLDLLKVQKEMPTVHHWLQRFEPDTFWNVPRQL
jgi:hypothetical protein